MSFNTLDSGKRQEYASGMRRDVQDDKPDLYQWMPMSIPYKEGLWYRMGMLANRGAVKYGRRNWELAGENPKSAAEELERFKSSALRHTLQWLHGETDEDHPAAAAFNLICAEMVKYKIDKRQLQSDFLDSCVELLDKGPDGVRKDGMEDCKGASCECQPWNQETPWTEEQHIIGFSNLWCHPSIDSTIYNGTDLPKFSSDEADCWIEAHIVENHPDFAWVWEGCPDDLTGDLSTTCMDIARNGAAEWYCSRAKGHEGECHAHVMHKSDGTCLMTPKEDDE